MRLLTKILLIPTMAILFADTPDWVYNPGDFEFTSWIVAGIVLSDGENLAAEGDLFAAFDEAGTVRGIAVQVNGFGPTAGQIMYEMTIGSNADGDIISFKYYDESEDSILEICQTYKFENNDQIGILVAPLFYYTGLCFVNLSFSNAISSSVDITYESNTEISGFQFDVGGVRLIGADGGDAEANGFSISFSITVLGFSVSGATIPAGSGTLLSLKFDPSSEDQTLEVNNIVISGPEGISIQSSGPGSIEIPSHPELFEYNQSTFQAFYYFILVLINDIDVESNDWVGVFNGDVCVGARQWDTSQCFSGVCEVPSMGYYADASVLTAGYPIGGEILTFKIFDASANIYYDAVPSENFPWENSSNYVIELLSATIPGCTDPEYCNYDPSATEDDGTCNYLCTGCTESDACNYSEDATSDDGSCYHAEENYDCAGNCIAGVDCEGDCGGSAVYDLCVSDANPQGVCDGNNSTCLDCAGVPNGNSFTDNCNTCAAEGDVSCVEGCDGNYANDGTQAVYDLCVSDANPQGVCDGNNSTCLDCAGVPNGNSFTDNCNTCAAEGDVSCVKGCDGNYANDGSHLIDDACQVCGGTETDDTFCITSCPSDFLLGCDGVCDISGTQKVDDDCGVCDGDNTTCLDCAEVPNGSSFTDNCNTCAAEGDMSCVEGCDGNYANDGTQAVYDLCVSDANPQGVCDGNNSTCLDCAGVPNGNNELDDCGTCDNDVSNDCIQGCDGIWGSELIVDICEICGGDCFGDLGEECDNGLTDCEGNCVAEIDCQGICGGNNIPTEVGFQCQNACFVCNPTDCIDLDSDCNMDISPYLLPDEFGISKIFPNPFNPVTHIQYELTQFGLISIKIYDIQGRVVDQLMNEYQSPGHYSLNWNAGNHASGMYIVEMFMQLENNEVFRDLQKILYLK